MIELLIKKYLETKLDVPVVLERQPSDPAAFVLIERTGGGQRGLLCTPTFAVQSYGPSLLKAAQLNEQVKAAMQGLVELPQICRVQLNTDYNYTDTAMKRYRYQAVFDLTHYREE